MKKRVKTAFGEYLVQLIKEAGISQEEFYTSVKIAKPYFYDLLHATPPPIDLQDKMIGFLVKGTIPTDEEKRRKFYDLAAQGRNEIPADIYKFIISHPDNMNDIRSALIPLFNITELRRDSYGSIK